MQIANENLRRYRENGFDNIEGWCNPAVFYALDLLDSAPINKTGGICEIGVHHGKFFLALDAFFFVMCWRQVLATMTTYFLPFESLKILGTSTSLL